MDFLTISSAYLGFSNSPSTVCVLVQGEVHADGAGRDIAGVAAGGPAGSGSGGCQAGGPRPRGGVSGGVARGP